MWDIKIITYHHVLQSTSTAHFSDIDPMVGLSLLVAPFTYQLF